MLFQGLCKGIKSLAEIVIRVKASQFKVLLDFLQFTISNFHRRFDVL